MSTYKVLLRGIEIATCTQIANTQLHPVKNCCAKEMMKLGPGEVEQIPAATQLVSGRAKTTELFWVQSAYPLPYPHSIQPSSSFFSLLCLIS